MKLTDLQFNGIIKNYVTVLQKQRPFRATRNYEVLEVTGKPGGYLSEVSTEVLVIPVSILIDAPNHDLLLKYGEDLAKWFNVKEPKELIFGDEPNRSYFAVVNGSLIPEDKVTFAKLDIEFLCPDPFKYGATKIIDFDTALKDIVNNGSEDVQPRFRALINGPITNLDIVGSDAYMRVGEPAPISQGTIAPRTAILDDHLDVLTNWSVATQVDNGHISGSMASDGDGFFASTWGAVQTPANWQGPSMIRSLPSALQDFEMQFELEQFSSPEEIGMIEIYLRDASGSVVAKMGISDEWRNIEKNRVKLQLGPVGARWEDTREADNPAHWNNFDGILKLKRKGKKFELYIAKVGAGGTHNTRSYITYDDVSSRFQKPVTSIQIAIRKYPNSNDPASQMKVKRARIWRLNTPTATQIVNVADAGDEIIIDHATGEILLNGEQRLDLKDFGSSFFALKPGSNIVSHSPADLVDLRIEFRERY